MAHIIASSVISTTINGVEIIEMDLTNGIVIITTHVVSSETYDVAAHFATGVMASHFNQSRNDTAKLITDYLQVA